MRAIAGEAGRDYVALHLEIIVDAHSGWAGTIDTGIARSAQCNRCLWQPRKRSAQELSLPPRLTSWPARERQTSVVGVQPVTGDDCCSLRPEFSTEGAGAGTGACGA
jgi:hypothetical protein